jgi:hypothetical protein
VKYNYFPYARLEENHLAGKPTIRINRTRDRQFPPSDFSTRLIVKEKKAASL